MLSYLLQDLEKRLQPRFILDVEKDELFINAGLQDRVIQVFIFIIKGKRHQARSRVQFGKIAIFVG